MPALRTAAQTGYRTSGSHAGAGQLKVTQVRGLVGLKQNQRETVRTLGLKRIGDVVIKENRPEIRGMVRTVQHLVAVEEIGEAAIARVSLPGSNGMSELQTRLMSTDEGVERFGQDRDEFVEWQKSANGNSLIWSSELRLPEILDVVQTTIGPIDPGQRGIVDFDGELSKPTTAAAARQLALKRPEHVTFLRLEFGNGVALVWTPRSGSEELERVSRFAEASVFYTRETVTAAALTMGRTATAHLVALADTIAQSVAA